MGLKDKDGNVIDGEAGYRPSQEELEMMCQPTPYVRRSRAVFKDGHAISQPDELVVDRTQTHLIEPKRKPRSKERPDWVKEAMAKVRAKRKGIGE